HGLDYDTSNAYSWNPQPTQQAGIPIPKIYGTYKIESPNIIATNIQNKVDGYQYLNILSCIGIGPYKRIYDFKLNDQPIGNYQGITVYTQRGNLNQGLNFNFVDTRTEYNLSIKLSQNQPYIYQTVGDNFDGIEVDITFPNGLYYPNDAGGLDLVIVDFRVEIRRLGDSHWTPISFQAANISEKVSVLPHWSLGRQVQDFRGRWYWEECRRGSSNPYEHNEGDEEYIYGKGFCNWKWLSGRVQLATQVADFTSAVGSKAAVTRRYFRTKLLQKGTYEIKVTKLANLWLSSRKLRSTPFENVVYLHARGGTHPSLTAIADSTSTKYSNSMYLTAVREVYYDDFIYPRHALVAINARATDQLSGSIRLSCMVEGAMVRIYNPDTQTWTVDTTDNPAWIAYDILTKPVFNNNLAVVKYRGFHPSQLKLDEWVEAAQYFDELVPDGKGGYEKRCTFNGIFDSSTSTWSAVLDVLQVGRASPTWDGTKIGIVIDKRVGDDDLDGIVQVFGMGNIIKDSFRESWLSATDRAAVITADFINAENDYRRDTFTLTNKNINSSNSVRLPLFGATKPSQVWRELMFRLKKNELLLNTVTIDAGIEAIRCTIGDKVGVSHDIPQWGYSGRILDATQTTV
ncbi:MAG TPA: phage tail protein, partial [Thermodesulfovibrio thiophilus]|nr:phage tail protein [Thermodesulfovibrio thiophilus]